jgi:hypothetical protein
LASHAPRLLAITPASTAGFRQQDPYLRRSRRAYAADGLVPSRLIHVIANRLGVPEAECRLHAIAYFREAFHLSLGDAMRLGGFQVFSDGGSDDVSLDQDLARIIATTRDSWIDRVGG